MLVEPTAVPPLGAISEVIVHQLTALSETMSARDMRHPERFRGTIMSNRLRTEATDHLSAAGRAVGARRFVVQSFGSFRFAHRRSGHARRTPGARPLTGAATFFTETLHPSESVKSPLLVIDAKGTLTDGRRAEVSRVTARVRAPCDAEARRRAAHLVTAPLRDLRSVRAHGSVPRVPSDGAVQREQEAEARPQQQALASEPATAPEPALAAGLGTGGPLTAVSPRQVLALQRTAGNAAVSALVARQPAAPPAKDTPKGESITGFSSVQDAKSAVIAELENLKDHQLIALDTLQKTADVKDPPKEPSLAEKIITALMLAAIDQALGGLAGSLAGNIRLYGGAYGGKVAADILYDCEATASAINDFLKDQIKAGAKGLYAELFPPGKPLSTTPVIAFFDRQKKMYAEMGTDRVTKFTNKASEFDGMDKEKALISLEILRKSIRDSARAEGAASGSTYLTALSAYANLIAELRLGRTEGKEHAAGEEDAARLSGAGGQGVLHLQVRLDDWKPVIQSASMGELNEHLRSSFADRKISDLGINVSVKITNHGHTWIARNTGGTVFFGPRETGQAYHYVSFNVMRHYTDPSDKRQLFARQSLTGAGGWGYIDENGKHISYEEPGLWDDDEDVARKKDVQEVWDLFRSTSWEGAHKLMEEHIYGLTTPGTISAS
jgi:hypothetical protein